MLLFYRIGCAVGCAIFLTACTTDFVKSVDKQISEYAGYNCSATNLSIGEDYCQYPKQSYVQAQVYCYKTMGGVDCYYEPNPYRSEQSERVRQTLALGSHGAEVLTAEEFELRQIMSKNETEEAVSSD
jgi:hypothetical protein